MPPDLGVLSTLIGSNYPCLELIFMVRNVFEPLKFYCIFNDKSAAWSNFIMQLSESFTAHMAKILILRQRKSEQILFVRFLSLNIKIPSPHVPQNSSESTEPREGVCKTLCPNRMPDPTKRQWSVLKILTKIIQKLNSQSTYHHQQDFKL